MLTGVLGHLLRKKNGKFCIKIKPCLYFLETSDTNFKIFDGL